MYLVSILATSRCVNEIVLANWRVRDKPLQFGVFINIRTLLEASLAIYLVVVVNMSWQGQVYSTTTVYFIFAIIGVFILHRKGLIFWKLNLKYLRHALLFGLPLIVPALAGQVNSSVNRIFISNMVGIADMGIYTLGYQIGGVVYLIYMAYNQAFTPWLYRKLNNGSMKDKTQIVKITYLYFAFLIITAIFLGILAPLALKFIVADNFYDAHIYVLWIALGFAFDGMYVAVNSYIYYAEKTRLIIIPTLSGAIINIILTYLFLRELGPVGAAYAKLISSMWAFLLAWYISIKVYPMPWWKITNKL